MKNINLSSLSEQALKLLIKDCERKIGGCQADLEVYDLYVQCQRDLLKRRSQKRNVLTLMFTM